ncbi:protein serine/threonine kinase [Cavenderia fasciculata]|uniref:Protein serine/threonine kinase n=1 Tax=Cavenderia fasciculata TaxID=261658 RepID=F4PNL9_CACFS|nr:protein serine/threonine kinase [Cavenderia fasciculata]EGG23072.1 protein serine/threonine kinase [Cavenderia fasciculata]|eukprot:XP_004360923.1 protein serine/threonine kinase [Cavenderia fasciculata]
MTSIDTLPLATTPTTTTTTTTTIMTTTKNPSSNDSPPLSSASTTTTTIIAASSSSSTTTPTSSSSSSSAAAATSSSSSSTAHRRTHSRNISIGGGKNVATLHDYSFSYLSKQPNNNNNNNNNLQQLEEQPKQKSTKQSSNITPHKGATIKITRDLLQLYKICNPKFSYISTLNPRRVLTHPSEGVSNFGHDNGNSDLIIYVGDIIGSNYNQRFKVLDSLGQGTFGQVVKCQNIDTNELVAVKILKNKPAYHHQGGIEVQMLRLVRSLIYPNTLHRRSMLNTQYDPEDKSNLLRLLDDFIFQDHLCIVFELLSVNLFELIKQNNFRGLSTNLIKVFLIQILDALVVLSRANMIHCDLKPENILLQSVNSPNIKLIDFGSACFENNTVYTYIQSRHYRSPEVLTNVGYTGSIDIWSLGCISAELFLGLPLFPGTSEYNQICRIIDMKGSFSQELLDTGKNTLHYFNRSIENGKTVYTLKTEEEYSRETNQTLPQSKKYFNYKTLPDIIQNYTFKKNISPLELEKEKQNRLVFTDFVSGLLNLNPNERWTAAQARDHPFITGATYTGPFIPDPAKKRVVSTPPRPIHLTPQYHGIGGGAGSSQQAAGSFGKKLSMGIPIGSLKQMSNDQYNFPESYSPRGLYGANPYNANPTTASLALGQSPSLFGGNPTYYLMGGGAGSAGGASTPGYFPNSWGDGLSTMVNSKRGRSKSDAPTGQNNNNNNNNNNYQQQQQQQQHMLPHIMSGSSGNDLLPPVENDGNGGGLASSSSSSYQLGDNDKPPIYPLNSPQRKRSQSGHVQQQQQDPYGGYPPPPITFIPRIHLDHGVPPSHYNNSNRFRSHSYGDQQYQQQQYQQMQQQHQQQQQQQMNNLKIHNSPTLLQHSAPQIFEHPHHYGRYHHQQHMQQQHQMIGQSPPSHSPPIPQSPHQHFTSHSVPLTPQLLSSQPPSSSVAAMMQDPTLSPALMSLGGDNLIYDRSPSEEMLFPLEVTPQLTSQQQKQQNGGGNQNSSPVGNRYQQQQQQHQHYNNNNNNNNGGGWKMDDMASGFNGLQIGDGSAPGNWIPSSPYMIPPFSIQGSNDGSSYDDPSIIGFSPYVTPMDYRRQQIFQSPPSSYNSNSGAMGGGSFKQSPPTSNRTFNELNSSSSNLTFTNNNNNSSNQHYHSFNNNTNNFNNHFSTSHPHSNYSAPSKSNQPQLLQQSPPTNFGISAGLQQHQQQQQQQQQPNKTIKNRPRNDAFSRTSPPSTRSLQHQSPSKSMSFQQQQQQQQPQQSTLSPNTPPFIPQSHTQQQQLYNIHSKERTEILHQQQQHQHQQHQQLQQQQQQHLQQFQQKQQQQQTLQQQQQQQNLQQQQQIDDQNQANNQNRKLFIGTFRDTSSPP